MDWLGVSLCFDFVEPLNSNQSIHEHITIMLELSAALKPSM
jgi:hypothetical protein